LNIFFLEKNGSVLAFKLEKNGSVLAFKYYQFGTPTSAVPNDHPKTTITFCQTLLLSALKFHFPIYASDSEGLNTCEFY
jgi:hypothetical protein